MYGGSPSIFWGSPSLGIIADCVWFFLGGVFGCWVFFGKGSSSKTPYKCFSKNENHMAIVAQKKTTDKKKTKPLK
jgi:hypothetical protein